MNLVFFIDTLSFIECAVCSVFLICLIHRREVRTYLYLSLFIGLRFSASLGLGALMLGARRDPSSASTLYRMYFYAYWVTYTLEAALLLLSVHGVYEVAMAPLRGLQRLGMVVFRWAASISVAVSVGLAFGPHVTSIRFAVRLVTQLQQTSSILTLCLLLFVCFAIRPMGLSYRSRVFGASLGLGIFAMTNLVASAWIVGNKSMYSPLSLLSGISSCSAFIVWAVYFMFPEPQRRIIVLPTTSPFLRWNQIAQALGDEPGYVAVGGVPPEMFADAEIEIMKRASRKMIEADKS